MGHSKWNHLQRLGYTLLREGRALEKELDIKVPSNEAGNPFVKELTRPFQAYVSGGPLPLDQCKNNSGRTVLNILKSKHPPPNRVLGVDFDPETTSGQESLPVLFDQIDGTLIHSTVQKMDGAAGPSGLDTS